jgi:PAS domain S-box-containing protein
VDEIWCVSVNDAFVMGAWGRELHAAGKVRMLGDGEQSDFEHRVRAKSGEWRWFQNRDAVFARDAEGAVHQTIGAALDITERKRAEAELKRLAAVVQFSDDAIIAKDLNGIITNWNRGAESIFGYKEDEVVGCSIGLLIPPDRQEEEEFILRKLRHGEGLTGFETQRRTKDGRLIDVAITASPIKNDAGEVIGMSKVARDISGRKTVEAQNLLLEAQLRQSQKLEAIGTLAGGIAHDFNNILAGIYGFTSLAQDAARGNPMLLDYLGEISASGHRAADLVQQILTFARKRSSNEPLEPVQLSQIVAEVVKLLRAASPSTIEIVKELAPGLPPVQGNASQLHQVITNLGTNAVHAMSDRRGRLTIRLDAIEVDAAMALTLFSLQPGAFIRLTVSDSGKGMDAETQRRAFEPFFTAKGPGEGTGLGLSVVHGIVRSHHGAIRLTSEVGRGTTVEIFLPAAAGLLPSAPAEVVTTPRGRGERILFVDDEAKIVKIGKLILEQFGYVAECETQVLKALARFERDPHAFDLVI